MKKILLFTLTVLFCFFLIACNSDIEVNITDNDTNKNVTNVSLPEVEEKTLSATELGKITTYPEKPAGIHTVFPLKLK